MNNRSALYGAVSTIAVLTTWFYALKFAPSEEHMGEVYRIIYLHVPSAITAFLSSFVLFIFSVAALRKSAVNASIWARATAEVGLLFTILTLATGSIWGRPTWGVWWTWDARLTTTLLLALLYAGYLILYHSMEAGKSRDKALSILGILILAAVGYSPLVINLLGASLLVARFCHAHGIQQLEVDLPKTRVLGNVLTWALYLIVVCLLVYSYFS